MVAACDTGNFDKATWIGDSTGEQRRQMLDDVLAQHVRVGMARTEIHALLGAPDYVKERRETYRLGKSDWDIDEELEYLAIVYSTDGNAETVDISRLR